MRIVLRHPNTGMVLIFTLVTVLLMSLLGMTLIKTALFHERLATNNQLDRISFLAAESVIAASISRLEHDGVARNALLSGGEWDACLRAQGLSRDQCAVPDYMPLATSSISSPNPVVAQARTRYLGAAPVPGFAVDQLVFQQFSTDGRAYFGQASGIPFGHLNRQVWRRADAAGGVFQQ
jgi:Tfp pilus assembly protein PilX